MKEKIAIYPGSFDPITIGHLDIIKRSAKLFDKVIVVVMSNHRKAGTHAFTVEERVELVRKCTKDLPDVIVDSYMGLLADYARLKNATAVVKGLRAVSDFEDEFQQALINKKLNPELETLFMVTNQEYMYLSSTLVRQIAEFGGDIDMFVPEQIKDILKEKMIKEKK